jgi:hypothetical protein
MIYLTEHLYEILKPDFYPSPLAPICRRRVSRLSPS